MNPSAQPLRVIHLDDNPFELERFASVLHQPLGGQPFVVESLDTLEKYRDRIQARPTPDIVILDIHIEGALRGGVSLVEETRAALPNVVILMCSAMDDVATIAECLNLGADDFLSKRSDTRELSLRVQNSYKLAKLKRGIGPTETQREDRGKSRPQFVGATFERISRRLPQIIGSAISAVHVHGESGTGKEMVADLFAYSVGDTGPFVKVNCGAIAPTLLESELFGHVKGAFTGAVADKKGLIEAASGGWIFLDEVASLSSSAQVALLRVLENQELLRVGATAPRSIQVRIISATNEPLPQLVKEGRFRKDLWQRLCETEIDLAPLRERPEEIEALVHHFCKTMPGGPYQISEPALEVLSSLPWQGGNIRELRNCLRAMTELHVNKLLTPLAIPERIWRQLEEESGEAPTITEDSSARIAAIESTRPTPIIRGQEIVLSFTDDETLSFDVLSDRLLLELTRKLTEKKGKLSLRQLAKAIGISRSTLSGRLKGLVHKNLIGLDELVSLVGLSQK
jgi:DNA-binding NtrC family response regulator